jgi:hypothetical protein
VSQVGAIDLNRSEPDAHLRAVQVNGAGGSQATSTSGPTGRANWRERINRPSVIALFFALTSCATISPHQFAEPAANWNALSGQLLYRTPKTTLIGDVLVRFSRSSDFELTFSKGAGVTLLTLRQDASFAEIKGPLVGRGWSGPTDRAPAELQPWLGLRDRIIHSKGRHLLRYVAGSDTFALRF